MLKRALRGLVLVSSLGLLAGCGGLSTPEAEERCQQEREADATQCVTEEVYQQCVSCYEECGDDCVALLTCPAQYSCAE